MTEKPRYRNLAEDYQQVFREQVVFGCHVHVGFDDREAAIQTMNRTRPWLPVLVALTANSPYWLGADTGYASYRTEIWNRWPTAGMPQPFASRADYDALVATLVATGSVREPTKLYWDVRPSTKQETLEFRVADVCMGVDEAVMVAGLVRAWPFTCHEAAVAGRPRPATPPRAAPRGQVAGRPPRPGGRPGGRGRRPRPARGRDGAGCSWPRSGPGWRPAATSRR